MGQRNQVADALRAIAALWVCLYHFTGGIGIGSFGYLGGQNVAAFAPGLIALAKSYPWSAVNSSP